MIIANAEDIYNNNAYVRLTCSTTSIVNCPWASTSATGTKSLKITRETEVTTPQHTKVIKCQSSLTHPAPETTRSHLSILILLVAIPAPFHLNYILNLLVQQHPHLISRLSNLLGPLPINLAVLHDE